MVNPSRFLGRRRHDRRRQEIRIARPRAIKGITRIRLGRLKRAKVEIIPRKIAADAVSLERKTYRSAADTKYMRASPSPSVANL